LVYKDNIAFIFDSSLFVFMVKKVFPETLARLYNRVYVCRVCKTKMKAEPSAVRLGKIKCKKCSSKALRPKRRPA
jgi:DNA-directed RNA polymerase subunit RPC12/RpoP